MNFEQISRLSAFIYGYLRNIAHVLCDDIMNNETCRHKILGKNAKSVGVVIT